MPVEVILPKVDMDMSHGTLATWHVAEGDLVKQGAALFDIETDKAAMEVEAPASGHLHHILAKPGDRVPVGAVIAWLYAEGEAVGTPPGLPAAEAVAAKADTAKPAPTAHPVLASPPEDMPVTGLRATPAARKSAREAGIALAEVSGTGPLGRIQRADVAGFLRNSTAEAASQSGGWTPEPGPLHVSRRGGAGIPLLLIHGFTADSQSWAPLEKALGPRRPLIRMDLPGHGKSPKRRIGSFAELARMIVDAFDDATRDVAQVHVIGHSLGGALALALADIRARRLASLSLLAPAGLGPEIDAAALQGITRATRPESLAPWLRRLTATPDAISDDYARAAMAARRDPALRAAQSDMAAALFADGVQTFDLRAALARLDLPAQILWGRQDHILPQRHALAADGDFAIHLLAGAGHVPQIECPDRVARIIMRQVSAVEAPA